MSAAIETITAAYTVEEFCRAHGGISKVFFYELLKRGRGPRTMLVGRRRLISAEAAAAWRAQMENEASGEVA